MNSTFSKMAPYIKLLLDILTGNRISLSFFPSFRLSFFPSFLLSFFPSFFSLLFFPFLSLSLSTPSLPHTQSVCLSLCLFLYSSKPLAFSFCLVRSCSSSVVRYHIIWAPQCENGSEATSRRSEVRGGTVPHWDLQESQLWKEEMNNLQFLTGMGSWHAAELGSKWANTVSVVPLRCSGITSLWSFFLQWLQNLFFSCRKCVQD